MQTKIRTTANNYDFNLDDSSAGLPCILVGNSETIQLSLTYPPTRAGQWASIEVQDGGQIVGGNLGAIMQIGADGSLNFSYQVSPQYGIHRVEVRVGDEARQFNFWVGTDDTSVPADPTGGPTLRQGETGCGNGTKGGGTNPQPQPKTNDPISIYSANEFKEIEDLKIWGGVGEHQLVWKRWAHSRTTSSGVRSFGTGHNWRHGYQWEMTDITGYEGQQVWIYNEDGNRESLTYPDGTVVGYDYTDRNQISDIKVGGSLLAANEYDPNGNRTIKNLINGVTTTYAYDDASRLTQIPNPTHR
jgi:YD repeat-containing protein